MIDPLPDVWTSRDYPVLREVVRRIDLGDRFLSTQDVADGLGMPIEDVERAGAALTRRGLVRLGNSMAAEIDTFDEVSGAAYLLTGLHPDGDDMVSRLVSALRQAATQAGDEDERSRLRRAADYLGDLPRNVLGGVLTAVLTGGVPG